MDYKYFELEDAQERNRLTKSLIPRFLLMLYYKRQYRRRYPKAFITASSKVAATAVIGDHCMVRESHIGSAVCIGAFTTTGPQSRFYGKGKIAVGKYCSIAPECLFWSENHLTNRVSTYPFECVRDGCEDKYQEYTGEDITVGHDVWIGQRSIILAGARIGHGCIVAAGAVVPRGEYPPYSIIGGVPAKVIKSRFDRATVEMLLAQQWWDKPPEEVFGSMMDFLHKDFSADLPAKKTGARI